ncbi:MAG: phosphoribosylformylglycinamidine synthase subunit PurS [Methanophagales archaeon]|nr:phosphoribosylformylglycinamidine synthase subunit PurS [Methanophagales archaeon]
MEVEVKIRLKHGVADPEGENTKKALNLLGFSNVVAVRTIKTFVIDVKVEGGDRDGAEERVRHEVEEMCKKLLANPVIHEYEINILG